MNDEQHIEQLGADLSATIETRNALQGGRTLGALTLEQLKEVTELDARETALRREIEEAQRRARAAANDRFKKGRDERAAQRNAIVAGRKFSEISPADLWALADLNDADERDAREQRGAIALTSPGEMPELLRR